MKRTLKRIAPLKLGIVAGMFYALFSLIIVPFFILCIALSAFAPNPSGNLAQKGVGIGVGMVMIVILPVMYGLMGFIFGALGALLYNLIASWVGGVEVEVE